MYFKVHKTIWFEKHQYKLNQNNTIHLYKKMRTFQITTLIHILNLQLQNNSCKSIIYLEVLLRKILTFEFFRGKKSKRNTRQLFSFFHAWRATKWNDFLPFLSWIKATYTLSNKPGSGWKLKMNKKGQVQQGDNKNFIYIKSNNHSF